MHIKPIDFEQLIRAFAHFMDVIGVKSSSGRIMLGAECFIGTFLFLGLALLFAHDVYASLYSWARGIEFSFHSDRNFLVFAGVMFFSLTLVFIRELLRELRRTP